MKKQLDSLRIERFRQIKELSIPELGHVNLIVGANNTGKSALLEALRFFAERASPTFIHELLRGHGELHMADGGQELEMGLRNLFFGREFPARDGEPIYVGDDQRSRFVSMEHAFQDIEETQEIGADGKAVVARRLKRIPADVVARSGSGYHSVEIKASEIGRPWLVRLERLFEVEVQSYAAPSQAADYERRIASIKIPCQFVPPGIRANEALGEAWDKVVLTAGETVVLDSLRVMEPRVEALAFVHDPGMRRPVLKLEGQEGPVPLQSMGDGMARVLQLVLSALRASDGLLLVDEFENGLHHSVQSKVWRVLFDLAQRKGLQIFATTHSDDCVRAFSEVAVRNTEVDGKLMKLERMPDDCQTVVSSLSEQSLSNLLDAGIEVRG